MSGVRVSKSWNMCDVLSKLDNISYRMKFSNEDVSSVVNLQNHLSLKLGFSSCCFLKLSTFTTTCKGTSPNVTAIAI